MEETVAPANTFIEFKSPVSKWSDSIFLAFLFLLVLLCVGLFLAGIDSTYLFLIFSLAFGGYYGARYLSMAYTTITINNDTLSISQSSRLFNKTKETSLALAELRGFEIAEVTRGVYALIIYHQSFHYYKYPLSKIKDHLAIQTFLAAHLPLLNKNSNPNFASFGAAFLFALKRVALFQLRTIWAVITLYWLGQNYLIGLTAKIYFIPLSLLISLLFWWFLVRKPIQQNNFRFGAFYWLTNSFIYMSIGLFFPILIKFKGIKVAPIPVNHAYEILNYKSNPFYIIKQLSYAPDSLLLNNYTIGRRNRSSQYPIDHQFATPLGSGDTIKKNGIYNLWLVQTYRQRIRKTNDFESRINTFHEDARAKLTKDLQQKPIFYEVVNEPELRELIQSSYNASKPFNVQLIPHWESLTAYRNECRQQLFLIFLLFVAINLIGCILIAVNR